MSKENWRDLISSIAGLGVPGLVLLAAMSVTGFAGAAAITTALASLGGPFGMLGGIALLGTLALISRGLASYGFDAIFDAVLEELRKQGKSADDISAEVSSYPLPGFIKDMVLDRLNDRSFVAEPAAKLDHPIGPLYLIGELSPSTRSIHRAMHSKDGSIVDVAVMEKLEDGKWMGVNLEQPEAVLVAYLDPSLKVFVAPSSSLVVGECYRLASLGGSGEEARVSIDVEIETGYWLGCMADKAASDEEIVAILAQS
jgi:hypothetical protein